MTSICAAQSLCRAPRRNRTADPILTMEPGTAVRTAVCPGHARPSGPKLSVLLRRSHAFTYQLIGSGLQAGLLRIGRPALQWPAGAQPVGVLPGPEPLEGGACRQ